MNSQWLRWARVKEVSRQKRRTICQLRSQDMTLRAVGEQMGISAERTRQILCKAERWGEYKPNDPAHFGKTCPLRCLVIEYWPRHDRLKHATMRDIDAALNGTS